MLSIWLRKMKAFEGDMMPFKGLSYEYLFGKS